MNEKATNRRVTYLGDSVYDLIDDAAQVMYGMHEGTYYDEMKNLIIITKSSDMTRVAISDGEVVCTIECVEVKGRGKIVRVVQQNQHEKKDLYWVRGSMTYNNCIMGDRGKLMMRRLIRKLETCKPCEDTRPQADVICMATRNRIVTTTPAAASEPQA